MIFYEKELLNILDKHSFPHKFMCEYLGKCFVLQSEGGERHSTQYRAALSTLGEMIKRYRCGDTVTPEEWHQFTTGVFKFQFLNPSIFMLVEFCSLKSLKPSFIIYHLNFNASQTKRAFKYLQHMVNTRLTQIDRLLIFGDGPSISE